MAILKHIWDNWHLPADPKTSFQGKTVIVTGSNVGLGYEAALKFVSLEASTVIAAVRDPAKGEKAKAGIENVIQVWQLDMSSYDSIKAFADRVSSELPRLDIAVLNAGVFKTEYEQSSYGWDTDLQINTLSTTYLGLLLLPKLKASKSSGGADGDRNADNDNLPVLEFVSSGLHGSVKLSPQNRKADNILVSFNTGRNYNEQNRYAVSKFFLQIAMRHLASLAINPTTGKPDVIVLSVCPGGCKSDLSRGYTSFLFKIVYAILGLVYFRSTEAGSRTLVSGATLGLKSHGVFWQNDQLKQSIPQYSDQERDQLQNKIWPEIVYALQKDLPQIKELTTTATPATQ